MQIVKNRFIFFGISLIFIIAGIAFMVINSVSGKGAFNYDVEFTGGTSMDVTIGSQFDNKDVEDIVKEVTGENAPQVQKVGDGTSVAIKTKSLDNSTRSQLQSKLEEKYNITESEFTIQDVSATISKDMVRDSVKSVVVACLFMLIYVSIRFKDFRMGACSIIALCHDALIVLGAYAVLRIPMGNSFIAAILTVLGYSINATIVIFDRIRENRSRVGRNNYEELVNVSVKQTLTRSLFTSLTTFFTVACLYVLGVDSVKEFVLPIAVGIVCGTFSSVCIAGNLWYVVSAYREKRKAAGRAAKIAAAKANK